MERIHQINTYRLRWCCDEHGITLEDLGGMLKIGVLGDPEALEEKGLTYRQLESIGRFFRRGVLFFLESGPVAEEQVNTRQYRSIANQRPETDTGILRLVKRVEQYRETYISLLEELGRPIPTFQSPSINAQAPLEAAVIVRDWLGLGEQNTFQDYRHALQAKGILVVLSNGYAGDWQIPKESVIIGFSLYFDVFPVIVVKKQPFATRQSFTLMHELGHLILHRDSFLDERENLHSHETREQQANAFAGQLLVPDALLNQIPDHIPERAEAFDEWLSDYRKAWTVSTEVILRRLLDAGRLDTEAYEDYRRLGTPPPPEGKGNRMYRHREPRHIFGDPYVRTVFDALQNQKIPLTRASRYLDNLKLSDLRELEDFCASV